MSINTKNRFTKLINKCKNLSYASMRTASPETKMRLIMNNIEKINAIDLTLGYRVDKNKVAVTEGLREEAIAKCWKYYSMVLNRVDSTKDESWNNAKWNSSKNAFDYDEVYFYGDCFEDFIGAEMSGENSMTKVVRYD
jgi:hypothetical protein